MTRDEQVTTTAATNPLRRPDVAFKAMSDDTVGRCRGGRRLRRRSDHEAGVLFGS